LCPLSIPWFILYLLSTDLFCDFLLPTLSSFERYSDNNGVDENETNLTKNDKKTGCFETDFEIKSENGNIDAMGFMGHYGLGMGQ
jgi:hypothetical protein